MLYPHHPQSGSNGCWREGRRDSDNDPRALGQAVGIINLIRSIDCHPWVKSLSCACRRLAPLLVGRRFKAGEEVEVGAVSGQLGKLKEKEVDGMKSNQQRCEDGLD